MDSQINNSEPLFIFKCVSKSEILVFEIDTDDGKLDISKLLANFEGGSASGASNDGRVSPEKNVPSLRRAKKRIKSEDTKSPVLKKLRPITLEQRGNAPEIVPHNGYTFSCNECSYKTSNKQRLKTHSQLHNARHTGDKPNIKSDQKYSQKFNLNSLSWTYIGEKPYKCQHCNFKCVNKVDLKYHLIKHSNEKPFTCDKCNFMSNTKITLKQHLLTHTNEKPFACDKCDYKCNHKGSLTHHLRKHTGEKPYACDECDYKCNQASNLKRHMLSHSDKRPFACKRCDYKSSRRDNLKQHLFTHTGIKPFLCGICDYKCCEKRALNNHMLKIHGSNI